MLVLNKLIAFKYKQIIKVVTGIGRCGKSILFEIYQDYLIGNGVLHDQIISSNYEELTEPKSLYKYIKDRFTDKKIYVFQDELQKNIANILNLAHFLMY